MHAFPPHVCQVDVNHANREGWTALMYASYLGRDTVVNLLLETSHMQARW